MASFRGQGQWDEAGRVHRDYLSPALLDILQHVLPAAQNPAAPCRIKGNAMSMQAGKPGWMDAPVYYQVHAIVATGSGSFTPSVRGEVMAGYHSLRVGLGYSRKLTEWMDAGLRFNYNRTMAAGYQPGSGFMLDAGLIWNLSKQLVADLSVFNISFLKSDFPFPYRQPLAIRSGIGYKVSALVGFGFGLLTVPGRQSTVQLHLAYRVNERINARISYTSGANSFSLGLGFLSRQLQYRLNFAYTFPLGLEGGVEAQYRWGANDHAEAVR
jgi:hypothetical protein